MMTVQPGLLPRGITIIEPEKRLDTRAWLSSMRYELITSERRLWDWVSTLKDGQDVGADWEADRLNRFTGPIPTGLSLARDTDDAVYIPCGHRTDAHLNLPEELLWDVLMELDDRGIYTIWWNYIYDSSINKRHQKLELKHWQDAMIATWIRDPTQREFGLKPSAKRLLQVPVIEYDDVTTGRAFPDLSPVEGCAYACSDANYTLQIWRQTVEDPWFKPQRMLYDKVEKPFSLVFRDEIPAGVAIDRPYFENLNEELGILNEDGIPQGGLLKQAYDELTALAGKAINLNSAPQIAELLTNLGVEIEERTESGKQVATGEEVLAQYDHPVCQAITKWRKLVAAKRNYIQKIIDACDHFGSDWLRFPFKQMGAPTGRTACGGDDYESGFCPVNVQSTPKKGKKTPWYPDIRKGFVAAPPSDPDADDWVWVALDFSQFQVRIAANWTGEQKWVDAFARGDDIHMTNARIVYGPNVGDEFRDDGKTMTFAVLFLATDNTVAKHGKTTVENAAKMTKAFREGTPTLQKGIEKVKQHAREHKWVGTLFGRRRPLHPYFGPKASEGDIAQGERYAWNTVVQGTEADLYKAACVKVFNYCRERYSPDLIRQVLWVHDELDLRVHKSIIDEAMPEIIRLMEIRVAGWKAPLKVDQGRGRSWSEAK